MKIKIPIHCFIAGQIVLSVITTLYTYRSTLNGYMFGDPFDARLQMVLHEHWYRVFTFQTTLRDTEFFYPYEYGLGFSDVFLVQGFIHSILRFFGFSMQNSWIATNLFLVVVGNLGWIALANKIIKNKIFSILFIIVTHISLAFYAHFTYQANTVGYTFIAWFVVFVIQAKNKIEANHDKINIYSIYLITILLIYALSCWYVVFFILINSFFYLIASLITNSDRKKIKKILISFKNYLNFKIWFYLSPIYLGLIFIFLYIYLPVQGSPDRPIIEMIDGSPRVSDLLNSARNDQAVFSSIYEYLNLTAEVERRMGLGIILPLFFLIVLFLILKNHRIFSFEFKLVTSMLMTYLYFVVVTPNFSLHRLFFENILGFNSIRYPFRYLIVMSFLLLILIFKMVDRIAITRNKKYFFYFLSIILVLDQFRFQWNGWNFEDYKNNDLLSFANEVQENCDYFYYDTPGGWWYDQIEAMIFAYQIGIPTVNGYSGGYPRQYPTKDFRDSAYTSEIFDWIDQIKFKNNGCFLTGKSPIFYLNKNTTRIDLVGFTKIDNKKYVANSPYPYLFVYSSNPGEFKLSFKVAKAACQTSNSIFMKLLPETDSARINLKTEVKKQIEFTFSIDTSRVRRLELSTEEKLCLVGEQETYFELEDLILEPVNSDSKFG